MISLGSVSLRAARVDCGISAAGGLRITEFSERVGGGTPSLASLRGTVACKSSKQATGQYGANTNTGAASRVNYSEANIYCIDENMNCYLRSGVTADAQTFGEYDALCGYSFCGTTGGGNTNFHINADKDGGVMPISYEVIGWSSGFFSGSANYYVGSALRDSFNETTTLSLDGNFPYITVCVQAFSWDSPAGGNTSGQLKVHSLRVYR